MKPKQSLSKKERLKSYRRIRLLFAEGERFRQSPLMVYVLLAPKELTATGTVPKPVGFIPLDEAEAGKDSSTNQPLTNAESIKGLLQTVPVLQMGVSVGARHFKKAVQRNLLKRRIREAYRKQKHILEYLLQASPYRMDLFLVYAEKTETDYATIYAAVTAAIEKLSYYLDKRKKDDQL